MRKRSFHTELGITLIEVLASITIAAIIITSIMSLHVFTQKENKTQTEKVGQLNDVTIAFKSMTRDIRYAECISAEGISLIIEKPNETVIYKWEDDILLKNNVAYLYDVTEFKAEDNDIIELVIQVNDKRLETQIANRGGTCDDDES